MLLEIYIDICFLSISLASFKILVTVITFDLNAVRIKLLYFIIFNPIVGDDVVVKK